MLNINFLNIINIKQRLYNFLIINSYIIQQINSNFGYKIFKSNYQIIKLSKFIINYSLFV